MKAKIIMPILTILILSFSKMPFAQTDSSNVLVPVDSSKKVYTEIYPDDTLSAIPTTGEISKLFLLTTQGKRNPFKILPLIASRSDSAIPAIVEFLSHEDTSRDDTIFNSVKKPNKLFAVLALDAIGTQKAEQILIGITGQTFNKEIRGLALKKLACNFYYRTKAVIESNGTKSLIPNKEIIHILLQNADDTTFVTSCNESIGQIAREGILNWTGRDFGEVPLDTLRVNTEIKLGTTFKQYRELWWQKNSDAVTWDDSKAKFYIK